ncbi:MAG TPA: hypothetical protein VGB07_31615, partial [Blastocatellia bacterium]
MKSPLTNLPILVGRRAARMVVVFVLSLLLAAGINFGLRGVNADSLRKFGITEQSRVGKLIEIIAPRTFSPALTAGGSAARTGVLALSGTKTVCASGCNYTSLTGASGVFADINANGLSGNLVITINGDLTEDGANALDTWTETPSGSNYTVTIQPNAATMRTISGSVANGMIRLNAQRVTIDGRFGGTGRFLTLRNTDTTTGNSNGTVRMMRFAKNNTIRNSVIEATNIGIIFHGAEESSLEEVARNLITDNQIRDLSNTTGVPSSLIYIQTAGWFNIISNNEMFNFSSAAIESFGLHGPQNWTIEGNDIYEVTTQSTTLYGIRLRNSQFNIIRGNNIHDLMTTGTGWTGIGITHPAGNTADYIVGNRISSSAGHANNTSITGIESILTVWSNLTWDLRIWNNQITIAPSTASDASIKGISTTANNVDPRATIKCYYNSVLIGGTATGSNSSWAIFRDNKVNSLVTYDVRNNIFFNNRTGGTGSHFAAGIINAGGTYTGDYNLFVGTGATAADFFDFSSTGTSTPVSFATWKTSVNGDTHSQASNPNSTFSTSLFVNPAFNVGDLHINPCTNTATRALVLGAGTPIAGFTTDYDGDTRDSSTPDIGSDEFTAPANTSPTIGVASGVTRQQGTPASN